MFPDLVYTVTSSGLLTGAAGALVMLAGASGISPSVDFPGKGLPASFREIQINGILQIDREGDYRPGISADGEMVLTIGGQMVVDNRGYHGTVEKESLLHLKKGYYPIGVWYKNEEEDARSLHLFMKAKNGEKIRLEGHLFDANG